MEIRRWLRSHVRLGFLFLFAWFVASAALAANRVHSGWQFVLMGLWIGIPAIFIMEVPEIVLVHIAISSMSRLERLKEAVEFIWKPWLVGIVFSFLMFLGVWRGEPNTLVAVTCAMVTLAALTGSWAEDDDGKTVSWVAQTRWALEIFTLVCFAMVVHGSDIWGVVTGIYDHLTPRADTIHEGGKKALEKVEEARLGHTTAAIRRDERADSKAVGDYWDVQDRDNWRAWKQATLNTPPGEDPPPQPTPVNRDIPPAIKPVEGWLPYLLWDADGTFPLTVTSKGDWVEFTLVNIRGGVTHYQLRRDDMTISFWYENVNEPPNSQFRRSPGRMVELHWDNYKKAWWFLATDKSKVIIYARMTP